MKKFQFPSNGKVYLDFQTYALTDGKDSVSIPFKREGVSGPRLAVQQSFETHYVSIPFKREGVSGLEMGNAVSEQVKFQFPSNGKVYLDASRHITQS